MAVKVLAIDGGGIRGIIPAIVLSEVEKRTKLPIAKLFDLVVGTSTGGILALGLSKPNDANAAQYTAQDLADLYVRRGPIIFDRSIFYRLRTGVGLAGPKYPADGIEEVLQDYFGNARLKDALVNVLVTAYDLEQRQAVFFSSDDARKTPTDSDFPMKDVARATSAAPTYFPPAKVSSSIPAGYLALVDGGVFANNPAMCAYVEAKKLYPESKDDILLVSLGTGEVTRPFLYKDASHWGLAEWAPRIIDVIFSGVSETVAYQLGHVLFPTDKPRYYRFQTKLDVGNDDMDDSSAGNMHLLTLKALQLIRDNDAALDTLCTQLT